MSLNHHLQGEPIFFEVPARLLDSLTVSQRLHLACGLRQSSHLFTGFKIVATLAEVCVGLASIIIGASGRMSIAGLDSGAHALAEHFREMCVFSSLNNPECSALLSGIAAQLSVDVFLPGQPFNSDSLEKIIKTISTAASSGELKRLWKTSASSLAIQDAAIDLDVRCGPTLGLSRGSLGNHGDPRIS